MSEPDKRAARGITMQLVFAVVSTLVLALLVGPVIAVLLTEPGRMVQLAVSDHELARAIATSMSCAATATLLCVLLGTPLAYVLVRVPFPGKSVVRALINLPLAIPHPIAGIALLLVFGRRGLLGAVFHGQLEIAIASAAPGIVLAMFFVSVPLLVRSVEEGFHGVDVRLEQAALGLGAGPWTAFRLVTLPLTRPAILAGGAAAFARSLSEFGSIAVLAYFPQTAPVLIWDRFRAYGIGSALPAAGLLLLLSLVCFLLWSLADARSRRRAIR